MNRNLKKKLEYRFNFNLIYRFLGDELGVDFVSFDDLLEQSDFVINCVPLNQETEKMFNDEVFKKMKKTAVFVNIGRGKTVDTDALVKALKSGTIFAAGLDVTEPEPLPVNHELMKLPNAGEYCFGVLKNSDVICINTIVFFFFQ